MDFAMISIRDLSMRLTSGGRHVDVLTEVSLDVPPGQFLAVAGPSGSGKSTLLGLIAGLDQPTAGSIRVAGVEITRLSEDALARFRRDTLGYVFQAYHLIPTLTALENVAVPLELAGDPDALPRATALLAEVGLADRAHHYPVQLSGGEQQRVAVARAIARRPALLLADEPTGNLDSGTGKQIIELLVGLRDTLASTLVLVTHDAALAARADRVVTLRDGRVVERRADGRPPRVTAALAMAWRETRGAGRHFIYFVACVTVGVAAIVAVGSFARSLEATVGRSARSLMGGDVEIRASRPLSADAALAVTDLARGGAAVTRVRELAAMAQAGTGADARTQLVELKAVEPGYPFYGRLVANPDRPLHDLIGGGRALVQDSLLSRLGLRVGDRVRIGEVELTLSGVIAQEPDRAVGVFSLGPAHADRGRGSRPDRPRAAGQPRAPSHVVPPARRTGPRGLQGAARRGGARHRRPHHHLCAGTTRSPPLLGSAHHVPGPHRARGAHGGRNRRRRERARLRPAEARHDRHPQVPRRDLPAGARHLPAPDHAPGTRRQPARRRPRQRAAAAPDALPHPALADRARRRHLAARHPPGPRDGRAASPCSSPSGRCSRSGGFRPR